MISPNISLPGRAACLYTLYEYYRAAAARHARPRNRYRSITARVVLKTMAYADVQSTYDPNARPIRVVNKEFFDFAGD